jgi:hypothetical protein
MSKHAAKLMTIGALVLLAGVASARGVVETPPSNDFYFGPPPSHYLPPPPPKGNGPTMQAPEIDPASLASAVTLLMGGLVVLRNRKT